MLDDLLLYKHPTRHGSCCSLQARQIIILTSTRQSVHEQLLCAHASKVPKLRGILDAIATALFTLRNWMDAAVDRRIRGSWDRDPLRLSKMATSDAVTSGIFWIASSNICKTQGTLHSANSILWLRCMKDNHQRRM